MKQRVPPGSEWTVSAELRAPDGAVLARMVDLQWSNSFVTTAHHGAIGHALQVALNGALLRAGLPPVKQIL